MINIMSQINKKLNNRYNKKKDRSIFFLLDFLKTGVIMKINNELISNYMYLFLF